MWTFRPPRENTLNPILFRCASRDEVKRSNLYMIFELVIYVRTGDKVVEMSCGWCQMEMGDTTVYERAMTHRLQIKGGSPSAEMLISDKDIHKNRTGIKYSLLNLVTSKIDS